MSGITVIIPSVGRPSLLGTLNSLGKQLTQFDDLLVVFDGMEEAPSFVPDGVSWLSIPEQEGAYGHHARNLGIDWSYRAEWPKEYLWSIDDDDVALPGALDAIREAVTENEGRWFVFQMQGGANSHFPGQKVPTVGHEIRPGNIGTPCIVWPASAKARWGTIAMDPGIVGNFSDYTSPGYFGDYEMAVALQDELGDPVWVDTVIAEIRP